MEIRWLETFSVAAKKGSLTAAAASLGYARSTVTGHIQSLERSFGVKLFDRDATGPSLTLAGTALLQHAEEVLSHLDRARLAVTAVGTAQRLSLGTTESLTEYRLPKLLHTFSRILPEVKVEVTTSDAPRLWEQVAGGVIHTVLINDVHGASVPCRQAQIQRRRLWEERVMVVAHPDVAGEPRRILVTAPGCVYRRLVEEDVLPNSPRLEVQQVGSLAGVKSGVLARLGSGLLPTVAARPYLAAGKMVELAPPVSRTVAIDLLWNEEACPPEVTRHLARLGAAASGSASREVLRIRRAGDRAIREPAEARRP